MPTPWGIEFKKNVVLVVDNHILVVMGHDHGNGTLLLFWNGLGLDARIDLAVEEFLDEGADFLLGELLLLVKGELLVLDDLLDGEGGPLAVLEVEVLGVSAESLSVDGCEIDLALVFLGKGLQGLR